MVSNLSQQAEERIVPGPLQRPSTGEALLRLMAIMVKLRGPDGCPWDKEQTSKSLLPYLLEETYELMEAVEEDDKKGKQEELGDLMLHVVFQANLAEEAGEFDLEASINDVIEKLISRHPHVFGGQSADSAFHAKQNWEAAKHAQKGRKSRLDGVPISLPALSRARRIQEKAAYVGFDWENRAQVWDKVHEEMSELQVAEKSGDADAIEDELGDVLFSMVNLGRSLGVSSEGALRRTIAKFETRFSKIEDELRRVGKSVDDATLEEMDEIWNRVKVDEGKM